jgi:hypothetical protein
VCSAFEIICPVILMIALVYIRTLIPIKNLDSGGLDQYKHPTWPALIYQGNEKWAVNFTQTDAMVREFFAFDNYTAQAVPNKTLTE